MSDDLGPVWITRHLAMVASGEFGLSDPLDCHCYLLVGDGGSVLVDAGAGRDSEPLLRAVAAVADSAPLQMVLVTHAHADHAGGAARIAEEFAARIVTSAAEAELLSSGDPDALGLTAAVRSGTYPAEYRYRPARADVVADGAEFSIAGLSVRAHVVGGHSIGSTVWQVVDTTGHRALFTGDVVFAGGEISLLNVAGSSMEAYRTGLPRLTGPGVDGLYPGHGPFVREGADEHLRLAVSWLQTSVIANRAVPRRRQPPSGHREDH